MRRKGISMPRDSVETSSSKHGGIRKKLKFEDRNPVMGKNPLNFPYSESDSEQEMAKTRDKLQIKQDVKLKIKTPSSKPSKTHRQSEAEPSSSRPKKGKTNKINRLLREIYEMEVLERVIKKENTDLTERNDELFKENQTLKEKHDSIKGRNKELIRENMKLYRQLRVLRFKLKEFEASEEKQTGLDTLANLATTIIDVTESPMQSAKVRRSARIKTTIAKKV